MLHLGRIDFKAVQLALFLSGSHDGSGRLHARVGANSAGCCCPACRHAGCPSGSHAWSGASKSSCARSLLQSCLWVGLMGLSGWDTSNSVGSCIASVSPHTVCVCCPASIGACQVHEEQQEPGSACILPATVWSVHKPSAGTCFNLKVTCAGGVSRLQEGACSSWTTQALQDKTHMAGGCPAWPMQLPKHQKDKLDNLYKAPGGGMPCISINASMAASGSFS